MTPTAVGNGGPGGVDASGGMLLHEKPSVSYLDAGPSKLQLLNLPSYLFIRPMESPPPRFTLAIPRPSLELTSTPPDGVDV